MENKIIKVFLRLALSFGFLSAVADRLGMWSSKNSVWGSWDNFLVYTQTLNPGIPPSFIPTLGMTVTIVEVVFALLLLIGYKTRIVANLSGFLLLMFALAMTVTTGIKGAFDYSVYTASAAAFALSLMREKYWEVDNLVITSKNSRRSRGKHA